ncbi:MAG: hypothetical protein WBD64_06790 [Candidatus Zixiibacteriota bacterium]
MRKTTTRYKAALILILLCIFSACKQESNPTSSSLGFYAESFHTGCKEDFGGKVQGSGGGSVVLSSFNDTIRVLHANAYYNCCSDIKTDVIKTRLGFDVFEIDHGDSCDCMCYIDITTFICHVPIGTYLIRLLDTGGRLVDRGYVIIRPDDSEDPGEP